MHDAVKTSLTGSSSRNFKFGEKVWPKISKIASLSMKICTETLILASSRKKSVFLSFDWSPVEKRKIKMYLMNLIGAIYGTSWKNSLKAQISAQQTPCFFFSWRPIL